MFWAAVASSIAYTASRKTPHQPVWTLRLFAGRGGPLLLGSPNANTMPLDLLIVDDSAAIRKILQRVLHQAEVPLGSVYEAGDGVEALAILKEKTVQLIFSDINMPNMDGIQFLTQLKANEAWKQVPVVMITTEGSQAKVLEAAQLGASGYLKKPFTPDQIKDKIAGLI